MANGEHIDPTPEALVANLVLLLDLEPRSDHLFVGRRQIGGRGRVFGGQVIAQALVAASRTVDEDRPVHSLHAYFLRGGDENHPIEFRVKRDLDGRSFSNRRVVASQNGEPILNLIASFQKVQDGPHHQLPEMPDVPPPDSLHSDAQIQREMAQDMPDGVLKTVMLRPRALDFRSVEPREWIDPPKREPRCHCWFRTVAPLPDDPAIHRGVLAYATDFQLLATAALPHGLNFHTGELKVASLDHALWFHEDCRVDDWLLYVTDGPWSGHSRGLGRGQIFTRDGRLVASVAQEGMLRAYPGKRKPG